MIWMVFFIFGFIRNLWIVFPILPTDFGYLHGRTHRVGDCTSPEPDPSQHIGSLAIRRGDDQTDAEYHGQYAEQDQQNPVKLCAIHFL